MGKDSKGAKVDFRTIERKLRNTQIFAAVLFVLFILNTFLSALELPYRFFNLSNLYASHNKEEFAEAETKLNQLSTGVNVDYIENLFGKAKYQTKLSDICGEQDAPSICKYGASYIFGFTFDYLSLEFITDTNKSVMAYSISTRIPEFNPKIQIFLTRDEALTEVILGKTAFSELPPPVSGSWLVMHREGYVSGTGNVYFMKTYKSGDYASQNLYGFTAYESRFGNKFAPYFDCPDYQLLEQEHDFYDQNRSNPVIEEKINDMEKTCKIATLWIIANREGIEPTDFISETFID